MTWPLFAMLASAVVLLPTIVVRFLRHCYALDKLVDSKATSKAKVVFREHADTGSVLEFFIHHFDRIFCPARRLRPRFWRCAIFSVATVLMVSALWVIVAVLAVPRTLKGSLELLLPPDVDWTSGPMAEQVLLFVLLVFLFNVCGDYLSLWETRFVLERLRYVRSTVVQIVLWTLDIFATVSLFFGIHVISLFCVPIILHVFHGRDVSGYFWLLLSNNLANLLTPSVGRLTKYFLFSGHPTSDVISVCFYTTLATTAWAGCSILVTRSWLTVRLIGDLLDVQRHPFGSLTAAVLVLVLAVLLVILSVSLLGSRFLGASAV